jgi:hypothetical protein
MRAIKDIELKINQLTPDLIDELDQYLDYLINKKNTKKSRKLTQDWAGGLKGEDYKSIDLQKKALDWRQK